MSAHASNVASSTIHYMPRDDGYKAQLLAAFVVAERLCPCHDRGRNTRGMLQATMSALWAKLQTVPITQVHVAGFKIRSYYSYCGLLWREAANFSSRLPNTTSVLSHTLEGHVAKRTRERDCQINLPFFRLSSTCKERVEPATNECMYTLKSLHLCNVHADAQICH